MRLGTALLTAFALVLGLAIISDAQSRVGPPPTAQTHASRANSAHPLEPLLASNCLARPAHVERDCECLECHSSPTRPCPPQLRRPMEKNAALAHAWDNQEQFLSIARTRQRTAIVVARDGRAFPSGRELLARTARRLI